MEWIPTGPDDLLHWAVTLAGFPAWPAQGSLLAPLISWLKRHIFTRFSCHLDPAAMTLQACQPANRQSLPECGQRVQVMVAVNHCCSDGCCVKQLGRCDHSKVRMHAVGKVCALLPASAATVGWIPLHD